jgi:hypothetical protein
MLYDLPGPKVARHCPALGGNVRMSLRTPNSGLGGGCAECETGEELALDCITVTYWRTPCFTPLH